MQSFDAAVVEVFAHKGVDGVGHDYQLGIKMRSHLLISGVHVTKYSKYGCDQYTG